MSLEIKDLVEIQSLNEAQKNKIIKLNKYNVGDNAAHHISLILETKPKSVEVVKFGKTSKTQKDYCVVKINNNFTGVIHPRFIKTVYRKPRNKMTNIFSDFWQPKNKS